MGRDKGLQGEVSVLDHVIACKVRRHHESCKGSLSHVLHQDVLLCSVLVVHLTLVVCNCLDGVVLVIILPLEGVGGDCKMSTATYEFMMNCGIMSFGFSVG